ncbi:MAG: AAA family ATPase [Actinomycetota bacterium]
MYKEFYNFSAEPFRITPDPGFLYLTDQHKEALAAIIYGIAKRKGFVCITGEVGVGKTTILRSYLDGADEPGLRIVYIYNPNVSFLALLKHIFREIGLDHAGDELPAMVEALHEWLIAAHQRRETLVLMVDEAQNMPIGTLENLRMLSNLETPTEKLVQIVLVGQPELDQLLSERQLRQVESRIAVRTRLGPLSRTDSEAYIRHRLRCVALDVQPAFTPGAITLIAKAARGIPRRINVICDNALMTGFGHKARPVDTGIVREVLRDLRVKDGQPALPAWLPLLMRLLPGRRALMVAGAVTVTGGVLWAGTSLRPPSPLARQPLPQVTAAPMPAPVPSTAAVPAPVPHAKADPVPAAMAAEPPHVAEVPPPGLTATKVDLPRRLRIVAPGDTLTGLAMQVYGKGDRTALDWVKRHNPEIIDVDRLQVGQVIEFPPLPEGQ